MKDEDAIRWSPRSAAGALLVGLVVALAPTGARAQEGTPSAAPAAMQVPAGPVGVVDVLKGIYETHCHYVVRQRTMVLQRAKYADLTNRIAADVDGAGFEIPVSVTEALGLALPSGEDLQERAEADGKPTFDGSESRRNSRTRRIYYWPPRVVQEVTPLSDKGVHGVAQEGGIQAIYVADNKQLTIYTGGSKSRYVVLSPAELLHPIPVSVMSGASSLNVRTRAKEAASTSIVHDFGEADRCISVACSSEQPAVPLAARRSFGKKRVVSYYRYAPIAPDNPIAYLSEIVRTNVDEDRVLIEHFVLSDVSFSPSPDLASIAVPSKASVFVHDSGSMRGMLSTDRRTWPPAIASLVRIVDETSVRGGPK